MIIADHVFLGGSGTGVMAVSLRKFAPHQTTVFFCPLALVAVILQIFGTEMPKYLRIAADHCFSGLFLHGCVILQIAHAKKRLNIWGLLLITVVFFWVLPGGCEPANIWH